MCARVRTSSDEFEERGARRSLKRIETDSGPRLSFASLERDARVGARFPYHVDFLRRARSVRTERMRPRTRVMREGDSVPIRGVRESEKSAVNLGGKDDLNTSRFEENPTRDGRK